jgi:hypothetical protein
VLRLPGASTANDASNRPLEAATHGGIDDDPALQQRVFELIHNACVVQSLHARGRRARVQSVSLSDSSG